MQDEQGSHGGELLPRELEFLELVAAGLTNREIAQHFWVTESTVKFHLTRIYRTIGVRNRTAAAMWLQREVTAEAPGAPQTSSILTRAAASGPQQWREARKGLAALQGPENHP